MFENLSIFSMASALARHSAARQSVVAENIANADTPGYNARDVVSFAQSYDSGAEHSLPATRPGHVFTGEMEYSARSETVYRPGTASPNGNNVSIEQEVFAAAEAAGDHQKALAIYRSALTVLRTSLSGGK